MVAVTTQKRIVKTGAEIQSIEDIEEIEQQWSKIRANKYEIFDYDFGAWRRENKEPATREEILDACLCPF